MSDTSLYQISIEPKRIQDEYMIDEMALRHEIGHMHHADLVGVMLIVMPLCCVFFIILDHSLSETHAWLAVPISLLLTAPAWSPVHRAIETRAWTFAIQSYPSDKSRLQAIERFVQHYCQESISDAYKQCKTYPTVAHILKHMCQKAGITEDVLRLILEEHASKQVIIDYNIDHQDSCSDVASVCLSSVGLFAQPIQAFLQAGARIHITEDGELRPSNHQ